MAEKPQPEPLGDDISVDEAMKRARAAGRRMPESGAPPAQQFIAEHTLAADESLSHLALKYYGHATPPYWQLIYEANKDVIGDSPNRVRPGMVLKIPALPENMK